MSTLDCGNLTYLTVEPLSPCWFAVMDARIASLRHPDKSPAPVVIPAPKPTKSEDRWADGEGEKMWGELHTMQNPTPMKLAAFTRRIPCGQCKKHWIEILNTNPAVYGDGWFEWTLLVHNLVNKLLGKDEFSLEAARGRWQGKS